MVCKIIQPWWIRKQIALTVARLPSWGLRCCRPKEPLSEPRRGEFRRRAANRRANRTGNAACQEIVFESSWRYIFYKIISMAFICTFTQTSWLAGGRLSGTVLQAKRQNTKKQRHCNGSKFPSLCLCFFTILMRNVLILKIFCVHQRGKRLFPASV